MQLIRFYVFAKHLGYVPRCFAFGSYCRGLRLDLVVVMMPRLLLKTCVRTPSVILVKRFANLVSLAAQSSNPVSLAGCKYLGSANLFTFILRFSKSRRHSCLYGRILTPKAFQSDLVGIHIFQSALAGRHIRFPCSLDEPQVMSKLSCTRGAIKAISTYPADHGHSMKRKKQYE